jgi:hypothetical protein
MIGQADTLHPRPQPPPKVNAYAKGALLEIDVSVKATGLSYAFDDFDNLDQWIPVYGQLSVSGGGTSDVFGPLIGYAAARHKTQMLTDNSRAKVTIQDGVIAWGESRVFICADERMQAYYGMAISKDLLGEKVAIIRGKSSISVDAYETTVVTLTAGDEFEVWFDRLDSTVRVYQNGAEICSKYFAPTDIPHGPGTRYTGVVMSARWLLDQGPRFDSFEAQDLAYPEPVIHDAIDTLEPNPQWNEILGEVQVNRHIFVQPTLGPKNALFTSAAVVWDTPMNTDSVRLVFTSLRLLSGKFRVAVRSNDAMTNAVGVEFDGLLNQIRVVKFTGPTTVAYYGSISVWVTAHTQWAITYDETTETLKLYKGAERTPRISHAFGAAFTGTGRYVGLSWTTDLMSTGVEPSSIDAYDVTTPGS